MRQSNNNLLNQKAAIGSYLDQLLHEATQESVESEAKNRVVSLVWEEEAIETAVVTAKKKISAAPEVAEDVVEEQQDNISEATSIGLTPDKFPLQCLMFWVAGNQLSVPLVRMKSVLPWSEKLTRLPDSPDWLLGLLKYHKRNIRVVDSNQVLQIKPNPDCTPAHVVILGDEDWAITCDRLGNVVSLEYSDIQWNQKQEETMIYGTIRNSLASLLNPDAIITGLDSSKLQPTIK